MEPGAIYMYHFHKYLTKGEREKMGTESLNTLPVPQRLQNQSTARRNLTVSSLHSKFFFPLTQLTISLANKVDLNKNVTITFHHNFFNN